jgi:hypothetical protein
MSDVSRGTPFHTVLIALSPMLIWSVAMLAWSSTQQPLGSYGPASLFVATILTGLLGRALRVGAPRHPIESTEAAVMVASTPIVLWFLFSWLALHSFTAMASLFIGVIALSMSYALWAMLRPKSR